MAPACSTRRLVLTGHTMVCGARVQPRRHRISPRLGTTRAAVGRRERQADRQALTAYDGVWSAAFSPTASASSPRLGTKRAAVGTPRAQPIGEPLSAIGSCAERAFSSTASASSPRLTTKRAAVDPRAATIAKLLTAHTFTVESARSARRQAHRRRVGQKRPGVGRRERKQIGERSRPYAAVTSARSAPTASASSPRLRTKRRGCGDARAQADRRAAPAILLLGERVQPDGKLSSPVWDNTARL